MASRSPEKLTRVVCTRMTEVHERALQELSRLHGVSAGELVRRFIDREWTERAEDLKKLSDAFAEVRAGKKKRAA